MSDRTEGGRKRAVVDGPRINPVPPRWQITERTSRDWRELDEGRKLPKDKKD